MKRYMTKLFTVMYLSLKGVADRLRNGQSVSTISIEPKVIIKRNNVCIHNRLKFVFGQFLE